MITECMAEDKHLSDWSVSHTALHEDSTLSLVPEVALKNNTKRKEAKLQKNEQS